MKLPVLALGVCLAAPAQFQGPQIPTEWRAAMNRIRADALRGDISFLASDLLEGRDTPSRGLDVAAEYIASRFRAADLEPAGNNGYFHDSPYAIRTPDREEFSLTLRNGEKTVTAGPDGALAVTTEPLEWDSRRLPVITMQRLQPSAMSNPGPVVILDPTGALSGLLARGRPVPLSGNAHTQWIVVRDKAAIEALKGAGEVEVSVRARAMRESKFPLRNVAGVLRGSDPLLRDTYVFVTAHYDHIGARGTGEDRINNGANDDASGTAAVIEIAEALARLPQRPRRSILFMTVAGEEKGLLGSQAFMNSSTVPLHSIVADVNLEQLGRSDTGEKFSPHVNKVTITGFRFTTISDAFVWAGKLAGIEFYRHANSDAFFGRSDNVSFARKGIPAHTFSNAFSFPDYHQPGDHWDKIDYPNYEKITQALTLGVLKLADDEQAPRWNDVPATKAYRDVR